MRDNNYIQFFDEIVGDWGSIRVKSGFARLSEMVKLAKKISVNPVEDPIFVRNHGTLAEWGKAKKERKNYAFYEGYSRLDVELERPDYDTLNTGAGVMFRVSGNVSLFEADLDDSLDISCMGKNDGLKWKIKLLKGL